YELGDEEISAVVLVGELRNNRNFIRMVQERFELTEAPLFAWRNEQVYVSRLHAGRMQTAMTKEARWLALDLQVNAGADNETVLSEAAVQPFTGGGRSALVPE